MPPTASEQKKPVAFRGFLVLEFKRFPWRFWAPYRMRAIDARDGMARSTVSAPQPWSAAVRSGWRGSTSRGRVSALVPAPAPSAVPCSAGLGGCRGLFMCHVDVSCPICRVSVRSAVGGWRGLSVGHLDWRT
jgi:hypothetical protein